MRTQNLPILLPNGGFDFTRPKTMVDRQKWSDGQNASFQDDYIGQSSGAVPFSSDTLDSSGSAEKALWTGNFFKWTGIQQLIVLTTKRMYEYNTDTKVFDLISYETPANFNTTGTQFWSVALLNDTMFFTNFNYTDKILKYTGSGNITVQGDVNGAPTSCMHLINWANHLFALRTIETTTYYPLRVKWSDTNAPTIWNSGNAGSVDFTGGYGEKKGWVMNAAPLGYYLYIYTDAGVVCCTYVGGGATNQFNFQDTPVQGLGLIAPRCLVNVPSPYNYHIILTEDGLKAFAGGTSFEELPGFGRKITGDTIEWSYLNNSFAIIKPNEDLAEFHLTMLGDTIPSRVFKWNYRLKCVEKDTKALSCGGLHIHTGETINCSNFPMDADKDGDTETNCSDFQAGFMCSSMGQESGSYKTLYGTSAGRILIEDASAPNWDTVAIDTYIDTPEYYAQPHYVVEKALFRGIDFEAKSKVSGHTLELQYSIDGGSTFTSFKLFTITDKWKPYEAHHRVRTGSIIYRFRNAMTGEFFPYLRAVIPKWIPMSSREDKNE